jgi:uncharacterized protein YndB with AHSA1/START domain
MESSSDRIERSVLIKAPRARVWQALADAPEFGAWFGVNLAGQAFIAGQPVRGHITHPGYEHILFNAQVDRVQPQTQLAFRWHPFAIDPAVDYSQEEPTAVVFTLADAPGGTLLTVAESGFNKVPAHRREEAYRMNSGGWDAQMENIVEHIGAS